MYLNFYGLTQQPFHITSDPAFLYLSPGHREALASILYALQTRKGFVALTGEVGTGKSTIVRSMLNRLNRKIARPIYVFNANISFPELLRTIFQELGLPCEYPDPFEMVQALHAELIRLYTERCIVILIIDEAQNMPVETLENLRMLSNLETTRDKLIQIVLVGQPELDEKLSRHDLRQLTQRLALRATIRHLTPQESRGYLEYRLTRAGAAQGQVFTSGAINQVVRHARGNPRVINILADNILITGFGYQLKPIPARVARDVIANYYEKTRPRAWQWGVAALAACMLLTVALFFSPPSQSFYRNFLKNSARMQTPKPAAAKIIRSGATGRSSQADPALALSLKNQESLDQGEREKGS